MDSDLKQYLEENKHLIDSSAPSSITQATDPDVNEYIKNNNHLLDQTQNESIQPSKSSEHTLGSQIGNLIANGSSFPGISIAGHEITSPIGMAAKFLGNKFDEARTQDEKDNADRSALNAQYQDQPWNNPGTQHDAQMAMGAGSGALNPALEGATSTILNSAKKLLPNPEGLQNTASKLAEEAMGMNSSKGLTKKWNPDTQQYDQGSNITKGIGTTALDQGVLGLGNSYDNALNVLKTNTNRLNNVFTSTQAKIDPNLNDLLDQVGGITTKTPDAVQSVLDDINDISNQPRLIKVLTQKYQAWEPEIAAADGNLQQLNKLKQQLFESAEQASPKIYGQNPPTPGNKAIGDLYNRLGGIVRQHIQDLANAAESGAGNQIQQINQNIGNLNEMLPTLKGAQRVNIPITAKEIGQKIVGPVEGIAAKTLNQTAKFVNTPIGQITQQAIPQVAKVANPWQTPIPQSQGKKESDPGYITRTLSNATPESLQNIADKFQQDPTLKFCGEMLSKAVADNDSGAKDRAIFCAAQIPKARALLGSK